MTENKTTTSMRTFTKLWFGEFVSIVGTGITGFALGVWVYQNTGSPTLFALITLSATLPGILISPISGALVDRWHPRWIMLISDSGAALCTLGILVLMLTNNLEIWHIYIAMGLASVCNAFQHPAYQVIASVLVPKEQYASASGMMQAGSGSQYIVSPVLAGFLMGIVGIVGVITVDFFTFFVAITILLTTRIPRPRATVEGRANKGSLFGEIAHAFNYLRKRPGLLGTLIVIAVANFMLGFLVVLAGPLMLSFATPEIYGITMSAAGSGMLVGSIALAVSGGPKRLVRGLFTCMAIGGAGVLLMGVREHVVLITAACFLFFVTMPIGQGCMETLLRKKVVQDMQGRVFGFTASIAMATMVMAYVVAGPLAEYVFEPLLVSGGLLAESVGSLIGVGPGRGIAFMLLLAGAMILIIAGIGYSNPRIRQVEEELPDIDTSDEAGLEPQPLPAFSAKRIGQEKPLT